MQRRTFVRGLGAALTLAAAAPAAAFATASQAATDQTGGGQSRRVARVGLQLYSLRDAAKQNLTQTLTDVAAIGYKEIELLDSMRNFGMAAPRLRGLLDRLRMTAPSTHIDTKALDDLPRLTGDAHTLGHEYVVVASLPLKHPGATLDDYRHWADRLNTAGEQLRRSGLWLAFHDEAYDFPPIDGRVPYDVFAERLDPKFVRLQLDTGNAALGGQDPLALMERYADRYYLFHVKDAARLGADHDAELGTGVVDLKRILARAGSLEGKHLFVEQESYPGAPIDSVKRDYAYLAKLRY